jgi:hypothetical protein
MSNYERLCRLSNMMLARRGVNVFGEGTTQKGWWSSDGVLHLLRKSGDSTPVQIYMRGVAVHELDDHTEPLSILERQLVLDELASI